MKLCNNSTPPAATRPAASASGQAAAPSDAVAIRASLVVSTNVSATAVSAPARAIARYMLGAAEPNGATIVVNTIASGLSVGPPGVDRWPWTISRPQISQTHGS